MSQLKSALAAFRRILSIDISATQNDHADIRWLSDQIKNMTPGALDVAIERSRQISEKGYDQTYDDTHKNGQLIYAAIPFAAAALPGECAVNDYPPEWPFPEPFKKKSTQRENLKIAAALLIAEYDRLGRIEAGGE